MNIFADFTARIHALVPAAGLTAADGAVLDLARVLVEPPRDPAHGDLATNAAMVLSKAAGKPPRALAEIIVAELGKDADVESAEIAGPGFINIRLRPAYLAAVVTRVLVEGQAFGRGADKGVKVNVEYVSANPTGPMHVGHCRGAVVGDAIASLLAFVGYDVTKEYYINDAGAQVDVLARSAFLRYREALGEAIGEIPTGLYPGDYLVPVGKALAEAHGAALKALADPEMLAIVKPFTINAMMAMIREDLAALNVHHDVFYSELSLKEGPEGDRVRAAIGSLVLAGAVYEGRLEPPKGQVIEDWEDRPQTLFRATGYGDDVDRPLMKSDGSYTYFASDIAYHYDKFLRGFTQQIDIFGADHGGYVKRMTAAVTAMSAGRATLDIKLCQLVKLFRAGEPVKMSKRSGDFVTLRDVVDEVGRDAVRFMMLFRKSDAPLDFDFQKVTEQSKDNPVFYVQYAHARAHSVLRQAAEQMPQLDISLAALVAADLTPLCDAGELTLVRRLAEWPRLVEAAGESHEPHRLAFYLHDLASDFHAHWNRGRDMPQLRFINADDPSSTLARVALVRSIATVLAVGLGLLGVDAPEEMR